MLILLFNIITSIMESYLNYVFFSCYFEKRKWVSKWNSRLIIAVLVGIDVFIKPYFANIYANSLITILLLFGVCYIFYNGRIITRALISFVLFVFSILVEMTVVIMIGYAVTSDFSIESNQYLLANIATGIVYIIKFAAVYFVVKKRKKSYILSDSSLFVQQALIPLISIIAIIYFTYEELCKPEINYFYCYFNIFCFVIINIVQYIIFEKHERLYRENYENMSTVEKYRFRDNYYHEVESHQEEIRQIKHDLKNQLIRIGGYIEDVGKEKAIGEIQELIHDIIEKDEMSFTKNIGINTLLHAKYKDAKSKEIECHFKVQIPEKLNIEEKDLTAVVGNVLDNAIEACEFCDEDRYIDFKFFYYNSFIIIQSENSTFGKVKDFKTKKQNKQEHGLGLKSIQSVINKYNGEIDFIMQENIFRLSINLWDVEKEKIEKV